MNENQYFDFIQSTEDKSISEKLKNIPSVDLLLANNQKYENKGKIEAITGQIDPNSGTIQFRASFDNENGLLRKSS